MIPALGLIFNSSSANQEREYFPSDRVETVKVRSDGLELVFGKLVHAIGSSTTAAHPIVLFIDDLQWSDLWSLSLLHVLLRNKGDNWFVFGAVREREVCPKDGLSTMLRQLEDDDKVVITQIQVNNLDENAVKEAVTDLLRQSGEDCQSLASIVHKQTSGNPLFLLQYLQYLCEEGLLFVDLKSNEWCWKQKEIEATQFNDVEDMIEAKMKKLEPQLQHVLEVAACLGSDFSLSLLDATEGGDHALVNLAIEKGFLCRNVWLCELVLVFFFVGSARIRWQHDKMRQAAFRISGSSSCDELHLGIGWKLISNLTESQLEENLFVVLGQLSFGARLLVNQEEKNTVARLCLRGGEKAVLCSNFATASSCFALGLDLLSTRCWRDEYDLTLAMFNCAAEAEYCVGSFSSMDVLIDGVLTNARTFHDKLRASTLQIYALGSRSRHDEAVRLGLQVLRQLGECFPKRCIMFISMLELGRTALMLRGRNDEGLLSLPISVDPSKLAVMRLLSILMMSVLIASPELGALFMTRLMQITLKHGLCAPSILAFSSYAMLLLRRGDRTAAFRYGQLALAALEKFQATEYLPRVYCAIYAGINTWKFPLRSCLQPLAFAHQVGLETGDIETAMLNDHVYALISLWAGRPLEELMVEAQQSLSLMKKYGQDMMHRLTFLFLQFTLNMTGRSNDRLLATSHAHDFERDVEINRIGWRAQKFFLTLLAMYRFLLAVYFNEYDRAEKLARESCSNKFFDSGTLIYSLNCFYDALTAVALAQHSRDRRRILRARHLLRRLKHFERLVPENCQNKVLLIEAELAAFGGNMELALSKFARSIDKAGEEGLVHEQALACERAGCALRRCSDFAGASLFLCRAQRLYQQSKPTDIVISLLVIA